MNIKRIILCADDYGQSVDISQAIIHLLMKKRLSAVSCLVTYPGCRTWMQQLQPYASQIDVGLHVNLSEGYALSSEWCQRYGEVFRGWKWLLQTFLLHQLDSCVVYAEIKAQWRAFLTAYGSTPDFIDGHHHVHQFPIICDAVIQLVHSEMNNSLFYVRCVDVPCGFARANGPARLKRWFLHYWGRRAKRKYWDGQILHNPSFEGIYDFKNHDQYQSYFKNFLKRLHSGGVLMCHPGLERDGDRMSTARQSEYDYLISDSFLTDCVRNRIKITRFCETRLAKESWIAY